MDVWIVIAIPVVSALTGLITTGIVMTVGGLGVLKNLSKMQELLGERIEEIDARITTEVKRRASLAAQDAKRTSPEQMAKDHLKEHNAPSRHARPKVVG